MKKMYQEGMLREKQQQRQQPQQPHHQSGPFETVNFDGSTWEEDADRLLNWSADLDFDAYMDDWTSLGTTAGTKITEGDVDFEEDDY